MESAQYADGDYYLTYGDGFRNTTLAKQSSAIAQTMEDQFAAKDYDGAVTTCARNVANTIADIYGVSLSGGTGNGSTVQPSYQGGQSSGDSALTDILTLVVSVVLLIVIIRSMAYVFASPCGWLCPFGLVQDLLHKIPFVKKIKKVPFDRYLRYLKYVILVVFVIAMPLLLVGESGYGSPWFCKLICPSGTLLGGIPLVAKNPGLQRAIGFLFGWKVSILVILLILSTMIYRPFCKYLCPLGAIYGIFNRFSLYHYEIDAAKCTKCGLCAKKCDMGVKVYENPNSAECIRCGKCKDVCPTGAIHSGIRPKTGV